AHDYVALVISGAARETSITVLQSLQRQAKSAVELYAAPDGRAELAERWSRFVHAQLLAAEPGSDVQLSWARTLAATAVDAAHLGLLRGLLDGTETLDGLTVDTELRWTLLQRLAATGQATDADIEAELAKDPTAAGKRHALHA